MTSPAGVPVNSPEEFVCRLDRGRRYPVLARHLAVAGQDFTCRQLTMGDAASELPRDLLAQWFGVSGGDV